MSNEEKNDTESTEDGTRHEAVRKATEHWTREELAGAFAEFMETADKWAQTYEMYRTEIERQGSIIRV